MYEDILLKAASDEIGIKKGLKNRISKHKGLAHLVMIATKPDIIKQAPLIKELLERDEFVVIGHTNQHYDWDLSQSYLEEFGIEPDFNLNIRGDTAEKQSQLIFRLSNVLKLFRKDGLTLIPYPYSDTLTASASAISCYLNRFPVAHVEAGLRTMTPQKEIFTGILKDKKFDVYDYYESLQNSQWEKGSIEPFPEQFNSRSSAPCAGIHLAPTKLNEENLLSEGYYKDRIFTVGNTISDAIEITHKKKFESKFMKEHPELEDKEMIRFCVHRRANIGSLHRFRAIIEGMEQLVKEGKQILFVSLRGTEAALNHYKLMGKVKALDRENRNFVYTTVLPYREALATLEACSLVVTDSGGIQEEASVTGTPCATVRFNSDRPESVIAGANILAPPIDKGIFARVVKEASENTKINKKMRNAGNLYGKGVSGKIVDAVKKVTSEGKMMRFEESRMGFSKLGFWEKGGMEW